MKKSKILLPALGILVLGTAASVTGTVAWFSANGNVTVDGMAVTTKVSSNMQISDTYTEASFGAALTQGREALLKPASTINGVSYFYTESSNVDGAGNVKALNYIAYSEGTALANEGAGKTAYDADYQAKNSITGAITTSNVAYGYIDYSFYLKATNSEGENADIRMTKCNLLYNGLAVNNTDHSDLAKAWRVALFAKDLGTSAQASATTDEVAVGNNKTILGMTGSANFVSGKAAASAYNPDNPATTETNEYAAGTRDDVLNPGSAAIVKTGIGTGTTSYQKVTVRLWLEGEDTSCTNETYINLTEEWTLDLQFDLVKTSAAASAVTVIGSVAA